MKVSICIPQYNRINYLLKSLAIIESQTYKDIEIVISDDCSSDDTEEQITKLSATYKYPIIYDKNKTNLGFDRNYRKCIEMANGEYAFVIGNDDSMNGAGSIDFLVKFLEENNYPDIGYCNMIEERTGGILIRRAWGNRIVGAGSDVALKSYSCFSFVGGLIYKKEVFLKHNTSNYDGSVYAQMYLGVYIISKGATLFCIEEPLIIKDLLLEGVFRESYRERIAKTWKDHKIVDGGLPSVINVLISALRDTDALTQSRIYHIFIRIYAITFPSWILDYRENGAFPEAWGLVRGLKPTRGKNFKLLNTWNKIRLYTVYIFSSITALLVPVFIFKLFKQRLYAVIKK